MNKRFRFGQEITVDNVRGYVVYPFAMPSSDGAGMIDPVTVKLKNMHQSIVLPSSQVKEA